MSTPVEIDGALVSFDPLLLVGPAGAPGTQLPDQTGNASKALTTNGTVLAWSARGTVDTTHTPLVASGSPTPGTGSLGVSASDHVHPLQTATQLVPLWDQLTSGVITLPRTNQTDSASVTATPASGTEHYTYFLAQQSMSVGHIRLATGTTAADTSTYANVELLSVDGAGALTQIGVGTSKTTLGSSFGQVTFTLTASASLVAGALYAVGLLQVASTPASLLGAWFNGAFLGGTPLMAQTGSTSLTTVSGSRTAPSSTHQFPIYYELVS